jgi:small basic protein (TIGR04137 family)
MTLDKSLRSASGLTGKRAVLSRAERIKLLTEEGKFDPKANCPMGLPKTKVRHSKAGSKAKKAEEPAAEGAAPAAEGAAAAAAPAGAAKAPAAKAPAKEAKK